MYSRSLAKFVKKNRKVNIFISGPISLLFLTAEPKFVFPHFRTTKKVSKLFNVAPDFLF